MKKIILVILVIIIITLSIRAYNTPRNKIIREINKLTREHIQSNCQFRGDEYCTNIHNKLQQLRQRLKDLDN